MVNKNILKIRKKLDKLDDRFLKLLKERTNLVNKVLKNKKNKKDIIDKKRILIHFPLPLANISARFFELFPSPLLTQDQLRLLKYDNVLSGKYKSNSEIGIPSVRYFDDEVKKYCFMWRDGGQFSTEKYNL